MGPYLITDTVATVAAERLPSDGGGEHWAIQASLVETYKLNAVDPPAYLSDVLARCSSPGTCR